MLLDYTIVWPGVLCRPLMARDNGQDSAYLRREKPRADKLVARSPALGAGAQGKGVTRIVYQFLYNNNSRQQTEARYGAGLYIGILQ